MKGNSQKEIVEYWLKNKKEAFARGQWREVDRINKILAFYGIKDGPRRKAIRADNTSQ